MAQDSMAEGSQESSGSLAMLQQKAGDPPQGDYLTLQELATWLKISRASAWNLVLERGEIPHSRFGNRIVRLARADVEAYLARCRSDAE